MLDRMTLTGRMARHERIVQSLASQCDEIDQARIEGYADSILEGLQIAGVSCQDAIIALDLGRWKVLEYVRNHQRR